ncbi:MAG: hypothetical protein CVU50_07310 [Candidatus Cloacimonetes bacterium HGW-Cloacimonetes-3]|jgi:hypothetical protein|nr:MAG: hypothetical protein CVU50_07310 [Candidatus Cloacimonetes bacterium HGW-Cloacimonetes-3]
MKRLILPLVLLIAIGMLAAAEPDPSAVVGYAKYQCGAANNMSALPVVGVCALCSEVCDAKDTPLGISTDNAGSLPYAVQINQNIKTKSK